MRSGVFIYCLRVWKELSFELNLERCSPRQNYGKKVWGKNY